MFRNFVVAHNFVTGEAGRKNTRSPEPVQCQYWMMTKALDFPDGTRACDTKRIELIYCLNYRPTPVLSNILGEQAFASLTTAQLESADLTSKPPPGRLQSSAISIHLVKVLPRRRNPSLGTWSTAPSWACSRVDECGGQESLWENRRMGIQSGAVASSVDGLRGGIVSCCLCGIASILEVTSRRA